MRLTTTMFTRSTAVALGCAIALGASACGGGEKLGGDNLEQFNLKRSDLPDGFMRGTHVSSKSLRACLEDPPTTAALSTLVAAGCSTESYTKFDEEDTRSLSIANASVVLLESEADAADTMREMRKPRRSSVETLADEAGLELTAGTPHSLPVSGLRDEAPRGVMLPATIAGLGEFDFYYCWRRAKVAACVLNVGRNAGAESAIELARKIDGRIADGLD